MNDQPRNDEVIKQHWHTLENLARREAEIIARLLIYGWVFRNTSRQETRNQVRV